MHGSGEHDLLFSGGSASNIETVWSMPEAVRFFERLCRFARVIAFDRRDSGVSDPIREDLTLEAHVADALAVMDDVGVERPVLFGAADCGRAFATLAAVHPHRAAGLIALSVSPRFAGDAPPQVAERMAQTIVHRDYPHGVIAMFAPGGRASRSGALGSPATSAPPPRRGRRRA